MTDQEVLNAIATLTVTYNSFINGGHLGSADKVQEQILKYMESLK